MPIFDVAVAIDVDVAVAVAADITYLIHSISVFLHPTTIREKVSEAIFLDREGLRNLLLSAERGEVEFTPWSAYIIDNFVFDRWWDHVGDREALRSLRDDMIHRVGSCIDCWRDEMVDIGTDIGPYLARMEGEVELF